MIIRNYKSVCTKYLFKLPCYTMAQRKACDEALI